jgi:hypothetical protein
MAFANPTDALTAANLAAFIGEVWADMIVEAEFEDLTILNFALDGSQWLAQGGDIAHIPGLFTNIYTVQTQSTQGNGIVDEGLGADDVSLTVNTHKYIATVMGKKDMVQILNKYDLSQAYLREFSRLLLQAVEDSLFGLYADVVTNTTGNSGGAVVDSHLRTARQKLEGATNGSIIAGARDCAWFFDTQTFWLQLAALQKFYDKSQSGVDAIQITGNFGPMDSRNAAYKGMVYGIPCYVSPRVIRSTNVSKNLLAHKWAFAFAIQGGSNGMTSTEINYLPTNLATLVTAQIIYGVKTVNEKRAVLIEGLSTTTVS